MSLQGLPFLLVNQSWNLKHQIDDEVVRLGWSKDYCKQYIMCEYGCRKRKDMTEWQLQDFLRELKSLPTPKRSRNLLTAKAKKLDSERK